jgi:hypothetical protein
VKTKVTRAPGAGTRALSVVAPVNGDPVSEAQRLLGVAESVGAAQWILVDDGTGLAERLAKHPGLRKRGMEALACAPGTGDWGRYFAALPMARGARCLLLPGGAALPQGLFKAQSAASGRAKLVFSRRPGGSGPAYALQDWVWGLPGLDLGAPVLADRKRLQALAQALPAGRFLGLRLARLALKSGVPVYQSRWDELAAPAHAASVLGEGDGLTRWARGAVKVGVGVALFTLSLGWLIHISNLLGLSLMGLGFFMVFAVVGED